MRWIGAPHNRRREWLGLALGGLLTALASEIKVAPFAGEAFRFGLGSVVFLALLLARRPPSFLAAGTVTGAFVVALRVALDRPGSWTAVAASAAEHAPAFFFYALYAAVCATLRLDARRMQPLWLGACAIVAETLGNSAEHLLRGGHDASPFGVLLGVAVLRSFFVIGLYSPFALAEQKRQLRSSLGFGSGLHAEMLYLKKLMMAVERLTAESHDLYRALRSPDAPYASLALHLTQGIHEVKKDSQRIYAGLRKLEDERAEDILEPIRLSAVLAMVEEANASYSALLGKSIRISADVRVDFQTPVGISLLGILNNLVANAVEAAESTGEVRIGAALLGDALSLEVRDDGRGIGRELHDVIFEPGYTTKFSATGAAATGIGLSHVRTMVDELGGSIAVSEVAGWTVFLVQLPLVTVKREEERYALFNRR